MGKKSDARILAEAERIYDVLMELQDRLPEDIDPDELKALIEQAKATTLAVEEAEWKLAEATAKTEETAAEAVETLVGMATGIVPPAPQIPEYEYIDVVAESKDDEKPSA